MTAVNKNNNRIGLGILSPEWINEFSGGDNSQLAEDQRETKPLEDPWSPELFWPACHFYKRSRILDIIRDSEIEFFWTFGS